jgi:hypothetical protein
MGFARGHALAAWVVLSAVAIGAWACSQGDPSPPYLPDPPGDASTSGGDATKVDSGKTTCTFDDAGCNTLLNCGAHIYVTNVAQSAPSPQGGSVTDGTYILSDYRVFTGSGGLSGATAAWFAETMSFGTQLVDGGAGDAGPSQTTAWEDVTATNANPTSRSSSGTATFTGLGVTITKSCPSTGSPFDSNFTATATDLVLLLPDPNGTGQLTYKKQ